MVHLEDGTLQPYGFGPLARYPAQIVYEAIKDRSEREAETNRAGNSPGGNK